MSTRRSAASRRAELKRRRSAADNGGEVVLSDAAYGITVRHLRPGGGEERYQLRWALPPDPLSTLAGIRRLREGTLRRLELDAVIEARRIGMAWETIGQFLGITGEAARLRWRDHVEL